jgi:hypothetical protein
MPLVPRIKKKNQMLMVVYAEQKHVKNSTFTDILP